MSTTPLVIVGAGGFGREALDTAQAMQSGTGEPAFEVRGFLDDAPPAAAARWPAPHLGPVRSMPDHRDAAVFIAIGWPSTRRTVLDELSNSTLSFATLVHPTAHVGARCALGVGAYVGPAAVMTTDTRLGQHTQVHAAVCIGHDCDLADLATVLPGAVVGGQCRIGKACLVGSNSTVKQGLSLGDGSTLGAGAVALSDVPRGATAVGVPAGWIRSDEH